MKKIILNKLFGFTLLMFSTTMPTWCQEINLISLSQLEDPSNSGKTFVINTNFDLEGKTLNIASGVKVKPGEGFFSNGFIEAINFDILNIKNKVFDESIVFKRHYTKPFLVEWFGAQGNGSVDDSRAIKNSILSANIVEFGENLNYLLNTPINVNRSSTITINGNGARIIGGDYRTAPIFRFGTSFSRVNLFDFELDGRGKSGKGIESNGTLIVRNLNIHDFETGVGEGTAYGLNPIAPIRNESQGVIVKKNIRIQIKNCLIENIFSIKNGSINSGADGIARAIQLEWFGTFENSGAEIRDNILRNVVADDGDVIQIAQKGADYNASVAVNRTIIHYNTIKFGSRRLIKASASNIEIYNNTFETFPTGDERNPALNERTYMVAFQPFGNENGLDQAFVLGAKLERNTFKNDDQIFHGNGGTVGLQQTKGAVIQFNNFTNSKIVFDKFNQQVLFNKNKLISSNITFAAYSTSLNNFKITNNTGELNLRTLERADKIRGVILFAQGTQIDNITIADNYFDVKDPFNEDKEITFIRLDSGFTAKGLKILGNTMNKNAFGTTTNNPIFVGSGIAFDANSVIQDNILMANINRPDLGIRFIGVPEPFLFDWDNNRLDLLGIPIEDDPLMEPSTNYKPKSNVVNNGKIPENNIRLLQSPAKDFITLKSEDSKQVDYRIHSLNGSLLLDGFYNGNSHNILTTDLPSGIYIITLSCDTNKSTLKFSN